MTLSNGIILCLALAAAGGLIFFLFSKKHKVRLLLDSEIYDDTISLRQFTDFFKSLGLQQGVHIPFIAKGEAPDVRKRFTSDTIPQPKEGYICMIAGIYEQGKSEITLGKVFYVKGLDESLDKMMANEDIVVLK